MAILSSLLIFGVDYMIRSQLKAKNLAKHRETSATTALSSSDDSTASDSGYKDDKDTESQPMLEHECSNKLCGMHGSLKISELLLVVDRETVL